MAIAFNVDSQVRPYATLSAFPITGSVKTLYIDESTSDLYYWDGSTYAIVKSQSKYEAIDAINGTGATVLKMSVCYLKTSSSSANTPELLLSNASTEATSSKTIGLLLQDLANGATGKIITSGEYDKFDTSAYNVGDRLWLSTTDGQVTTTIPSAPTHAVFIGFVTRKQSQNGRILVSIQNGYELREIHDVSLPTTPLDGQVLAYDSPTSLWKAKTISTGITIGTTAITSGTVGRVLFEGTGNVVQESANLFWDNTNVRLGIGTSSPTSDFAIIKNVGSLGSVFSTMQNTNSNGEAAMVLRNDLYYAGFELFGSTFGMGLSNIALFTTQSGITNLGFATLGAANISFRTNSTGSTNERLTIFGSSGNLGINTTTDAGFKLDVNGTARFGNVNQSTNANSITAGYEGGFLLSGGVAALKRDTTGYLKTLLDCGYDGGLRIRPYSSGFTSYVDVRSDTSAALTVTSTNQGFLPPRMTTTQKNAIASPATGLMVFDLTLGLMSVYNGTIWISL